MNFPRLLDKCRICHNILILNASAEGASAFLKGIQTFYFYIVWIPIELTIAQADEPSVTYGRDRNYKKLFPRPKSKTPDFSISITNESIELKAWSESIRSQMSQRQPRMVYNCENASAEGASENCWGSFREIHLKSMIIW